MSPDRSRSDWSALIPGAFHLALAWARAAFAAALLGAMASSGCGDVQGVGVRGPAERLDGGDQDGSNGDANTGGPCNAGCAGSTPVCNAASGMCVECTVDAHCAGTGRSRCDLASHRCVIKGGASAKTSGRAWPAKTFRRICSAAFCS